MALLAVPGNASSSAAWAASGRPVRATLGMCDGSASSDVTLPTGTAWDASGAAVLVGEPVRTAWMSAMSATDPAAPAVCVRVTLLPGAGGDACLSELAWHAECP